MQINKISSTNQNTNFKAVNMKYFKEGMDRCITSGDIDGTFFRLENAVAFRSISPQDALDTLKALLPYAKDHHLRLFKKYEESYKDFQKEFEGEEKI